MAPAALKDRGFQLSGLSNGSQKTCSPHPCPHGARFLEDQVQAVLVVQATNTKPQVGQRTSCHVCHHWHVLPGPSPSALARVKGCPKRSAVKWLALPGFRVHACACRCLKTRCATANSKHVCDTKPSSSQFCRRAVQSGGKSGGSQSK